MKIMIIGLGLIGASYAEGLKLAGHDVYGLDHDAHVMEEAIQKHVILSTSSVDIIKTCDVVILALYPHDNVAWVKENGHYLQKGQLLTDVSGTKAKMMQAIETILPQGIFYTSHHPMAGKEISGFHARSAHLFHRANFIIVQGIHSGESDENILRGIANDLKFGKIIVTDATTHDKLIAFTSQLTHVMAVCFMHADHEENTKQATGDSFRDLTRIAKINETMWSELFIENKEHLLVMMDRMEDELKKIKKMIQEDNMMELQTYLRQAKEKRKSFDIH
jgi:prephenate dehydrogenase